jgi:ATP synthase protein I
MKKTPADLKQLGDKIAQLQAKEQSVRGIKPVESEFGRASRIGLKIGAELLSAVIVGTAIGYVADRLLGTSPWLMVIFLLFGGAAGVLNVYRIAQNEGEQK